jgi:(p)ppGpp synthase/HD superfamily hydrolase
MGESIAPPSVWIGGKYISPSDIHRNQYQKIMSSTLNLDASNTGKLMAVYTLAKVGFGYKKVIARRHGGRYWEHPKAVSLIWAVELWDLSIDNTFAKLLHDNDEDTRIRVVDIQYLVNTRTAQLVGLVSNPRKTWDAQVDARNKKTHYLAISGDEDAWKIKIPDRIDNLRTHEVRLILDGQMPIGELSKKILENAKVQIDETHEYIVPIAKTQSRVYETVLWDDLRKLEQWVRELQDSYKREDSTIHIPV